MDGVTSQSGRASTLLIVIMAVLGLGLGASIYLNYDQAQRADQERRLLKGEITDLRYQLKQDSESSASSASPSPGPSPTPELTPAPTPSAERTVTTKSFVRLHARATTGSAVITSLNKGTVVTLGSFSNSAWQEVAVGGQHGYIAKSDLIY